MMTTSVQYDVATKRNDTFKATFYFIEDGEQASLAGCSARMMVRHRLTDEVVLDVSTSSGELTVDSDSGAVLVNVSKESMDMAPDLYNADVELTYADLTARSSRTFVVNVQRDETR